MWLLLSLGVSPLLCLQSEDWGYYTCLPGGWGRAEAGSSQGLYRHPHPFEGLCWGYCQLWALQL